MSSPRFLVLAGVLAFTLAACSSSRPATDRETPRMPANGHPGFDTRFYPGDSTMRVWKAASPYRWVGYYLTSPCSRDSSWAGKRALLERQGWGTAVLYVGQQLFEGQPVTRPAPGVRIVCSRGLLTPERGRLDAQDAIRRAAAEGFAPGSTVFLDIERVSLVTDSLRQYFRAWQREMLREGSYVPGTYAHRLNAADFYAAAREVYAEAGRTTAPPFWIAGGPDFALNRSPGTVASYAHIWQGNLDTERTFGGVTLPIDENVADRPSPSAPRAGMAGRNARTPVDNSITGW